MLTPSAGGHKGPLPSSPPLPPLRVTRPILKNLYLRGLVRTGELYSPRVGWNQSRQATAWLAETGETSESPQRSR